MALSKRAVDAGYPSDRIFIGSAIRLPQQDFVLIPAGDWLLGLERQGPMHMPFARAFRGFLNAVDADFDVCVIDTHPNPDIRLISSLASADFVLSPIQLNQESVDGVKALLTHPRVGVLKLKALFNPKLHLIGLLPTMVESTPFQRANLVLLLERYMSLMIRLGPEPGNSRAKAVNDGQSI